MGDLLDPKKNLKAIGQIAVLVIVVLGGIWFIYKISDQEQKDKINELVSVIGIGKQVIPWEDRADTMVRRLIERNKEALTNTIQGITHPSGQQPNLVDYKVSKLPGYIQVEFIVNWKGGFIGGEYNTTVVWEFDEKHHHNARVTFDSAYVQVFEEDKEKLNEYFRTNVYPVIVADIGE